MFHIALSHYAANYGLAHQESDPLEALRFWMEAMRVVNQRLGDVGVALETVHCVLLQAYQVTRCGSIMPNARSVDG
tara:strand:- start:712 stop:939 length:228 start_codon:yes stop_codon:yes gene_type:complete